MGKNVSVDQTVPGSQGGWQALKTEERALRSVEDRSQEYGRSHETWRGSEQTDGEEPGCEQTKFGFLQKCEEDQ